jgi:hypothetical protein
MPHSEGPNAAPGARRPMKEVVVDTRALVWQLARPERLGERSTTPSTA